MWQGAPRAIGEMRTGTMSWLCASMRGQNPEHWCSRYWQGSVNTRRAHSSDAGMQNGAVSMVTYYYYSVWQTCSLVFAQLKMHTKPAHECL